MVSANVLLVDLIQAGPSLVLKADHPGDLGCTVVSAKVLWVDSNQGGCVQGLPFRSALRRLAEKFLKRQIQQGSHDPVVDARTALQLAQLKMK